MQRLPNAVYVTLDSRRLEMGLGGAEAVEVPLSIRRLHGASIAIRVLTRVLTWLTILTDNRPAGPSAGYRAKAAGVITQP